MLWEVEPHPKIDYQYTHDGSLLIPGLFAFYNMVDEQTAARLCRPTMRDAPNK